MNLGKKFFKRLTEISEAEKGKLIFPISVEIREEPLVLRVEVQDFDRYSLLIKGFSLTYWTEEREKSWIDYTKRQARAIEEKVTYLLSPLLLLEIDCVHHEALMRSKNLSDTEKAKIFYELKIKNARAFSFRKIEVEDHSICEIPAPFSREVFEHLLDDLERIITES